LTGSTADSKQKQRLLKDRNVVSLPAHIKRVNQTININFMIYELPCKSDASPDQPTRTFLVEANRYLEDADMYKRALGDYCKRSARSCVKARGISADNAAALIDAGIIQKVDDPASVKGRIIVFVVPEWDKDRKRVIQHTKDANIHLGSAHKVHFSSHLERDQFTHKGNFMASVDLTAYYTQFALSDGVSDYMCFRVPNKHGRSDLVKLVRGPTGQSHMVFVAVSTTNRLLDFEHFDTTVDQHIDNIIFVGHSRSTFLGT
jgi:hypothetical protein